MCEWTSSRVLPHHSARSSCRRSGTKVQETQVCVRMRSVHGALDAGRYRQNGLCLTITSVNACNGKGKSSIIDVLDRSVAKTTSGWLARPEAGPQSKWTLFLGQSCSVLLRNSSIMTIEFGIDANGVRSIGVRSEKPWPPKSMVRPKRKAPLLLSKHVWPFQSLVVKDTSK
jgi:hypothetical protein